jgi:acetoacetyl-CoA synthetase
LIEPIWKPSKERIENSNITAYLKELNKTSGKSFASYNELYNWSVSNIEEFWESVWKFSNIVYSKKYNKVISERIMPGAKWFQGAELNFAENLLRFSDSGTAIISSREDAPTIKISYAKLNKIVSSVANGLKNLGITKGDRVAGFITNIPEAVIAMLAAASIGAIWSSCSPDFGLQGVLDRFGQIKPKILFAIEEYNYNGKPIDCRDKIHQVVEKIPDIEKVISIRRFFDFNSYDFDLSKSSNNSSKYIYFEDLLRYTSNKIDFEQLPFDHPVYIMYSSGTTGIPKCIVHGAGGTLLQHFKELFLHTNLKRNDIILYYTTCGWMMWNWLVSSLFLGASIYLYDGNPAYPKLTNIWEKIEEDKINILGTSPKFLTACQKSGLINSDKFNFSSLKTILSTGSPLSVENFEFVYNSIKKDIQLSSISGGTDILSCFVLGNSNLPVYAGEIQCRGLGMKVEVFNEKGESVKEEQGELVCTAPFPSMPVYFWNDPDGKKYKTAYFEYYPGIWRHGDFIKLTENSGIIIYGRSDATLNPGGVRIGTAEIYRIVESYEEVVDSIVIGQKWNNDIRIILFVVLRKDLSLSKELIDKIKTNIKKSATPRHVPSKLFQIKDVPRTISGKKVELAVTKIINGEEVENKDALANPESLIQFYNLRSSLTTL